MKAGKIHKLAASLYKPRGSKCGNKVAAYSPEIMVPSLPITLEYKGFTYLGIQIRSNLQLMMNEKKKL